MIPALLDQMPAREAALEDEAHTRNAQTAADFPPGSTVYLTGDPRRWVIDQRHLDGSLGLTHLWQRLRLAADRLHLIDPTR